MKVFLISFKLATVARQLAERGVDIIYWTGAKENFESARQDKKYFGGTIFHDSFDALAGKGAAEIDRSLLSMPPQAVWDNLQAIAWQVLAMIDRADYEGLGLNQKIIIYHNYVKYWYGVLVSYTPEAIVFADVPHTGCNYVIYALAKQLGIKTLIYRRLKGFTDRLLFFDNFQDYGRLRTEYQALKGQPIELADLDADMQAYYHQQTSPPQADYSQDITAFVKQKYKYSETFPPLARIFKHLIRFTFFSTAFKYVRMLLHRRRVASVSRQYFYGWQAKWLFHKWNKIKALHREEYLRLQKEPDLSRPFIYVPLHFQPECNTNPLGGIFDNQLLMIEMLSQAVPPGWAIYVKENPMQWTHYQGHLGRFSGYYEYLSRLPGVSLVPSRFSTYHLIDKARAVATLSGSAGWEAVLRGKGALVFGHAWYKDCAGVFPVSDVATVRHALAGIDRDRPADKANLLAFLKALSRVSVKAYPDKRYQQFSTVKDGENARRIAEAIYHELLLTL